MSIKISKRVTCCLQRNHVASSTHHSSSHGSRRFRCRGYVEYSKQSCSMAARIWSLLSRSGLCSPCLPLWLFLSRCLLLDPTGRRTLLVRYPTATPEAVVLPIGTRVKSRVSFIYL